MIDIYVCVCSVKLYIQIVFAFKISHFCQNVPFIEIFKTVIFNVHIRKHLMGY